MREDQTFLNIFVKKKKSLNKNINFDCISYIFMSLVKLHLKNIKIYEAIPFLTSKMMPEIKKV